MYFFLFFEQKTAYEMRISDWSSDVCSSDLGFYDGAKSFLAPTGDRFLCFVRHGVGAFANPPILQISFHSASRTGCTERRDMRSSMDSASFGSALTAASVTGFGMRSEEHTSELQSLMRISYAVFCLKKK